MNQSRQMIQALDEGLKPLIKKVVTKHVPKINPDFFKTGIDVRKGSFTEEPNVTFFLDIGDKTKKVLDAIVADLQKDPKVSSAKVVGGTGGGRLGVTVREKK